MICYPIRPTVGKWHVRLGFSSLLFIGDYTIGWRRFEFAVFRLNCKPEPGAQCTRKHYTGFWFRMRFFWPMEIER